MEPLSVGNIVSAGLRIYRDNFAKYFKIAFLGYLWIFAPLVILVIAVAAISAIFVNGSSYSLGLFVLVLVVALVTLFYASARFAAMSGLIARLAYGEVAEQPEAVAEAQRQVKPKMWSFLFAGILSSLIFFGVAICYFILSGIVAYGGFALGQNSAIAIAITVVTSLVFIIGAIWLVSRLFLIELPLAVESGVTASGTIGRSWELTKGAVGKIQLVIFISFLISIPVIIAVQIVSTIAQVAIAAVLSNSPPALATGGFYVLYIAFTLASGAFMIPFWQSIKAVIYYDLRVRREGMGMNLRK